MDAPVLRGLQVKVIRRSEGHRDVVVFGMRGGEIGPTHT